MALIEIHSSDEESSVEKGGSSTSGHVGGQGARARHFHQQRVDQIFAEEGHMEFLHAFRNALTQEETGDSPQIEGASPTAGS